MITVNGLYEINKSLVETFGGMGVGFKDENLVESCVVQIHQEVFGKTLYPDIEDKISFLVFSIIANHLFLDGNKRTGAAVLEKLCKDNKIILNYTDEELIDLVLKVAKSEMDNKGIKNWIINHKELKISRSFKVGD